LGLGMGMGMNFLCGDGYGIAKPVPAPPRCHPYTSQIKEVLNTILAFNVILLAKGNAQRNFWRSPY